MSQFAVKWIFILDKDFVFNVRQYLTGNFSEGCAFVDRQGKRRLEIHPNGDAKVLAGYSWDGCTPKFAIWDIVFGIPDGIPNTKTYRLNGDALACQSLRHRHPVSDCGVQARACQFGL